MDSHLVFIFYAFMLGGLASVSLPLGSVVGLISKPNRILIGALSAFGGGALIAALSVELVAPTVDALVKNTVIEERSEHITALVTLIGSAIIGGLLFIVLDQLVNAKGGFLRKYTTTIDYLRHQRHKRYREILDAFGNIEALHKLTPDSIHRLVANVQHVTYLENEVIFSEGEEGDYMVVIQDGEVELSEMDQPFKKLGKGGIIGVLSLMSGAPRSATATAIKDVHGLKLHKADFEHLCEAAPDLDDYLRNLASEDIKESYSVIQQRTNRARAWSMRAVSALRERAALPTSHEIKRMRQEHGGSPMAIWLGILLDAIPESLIIGTATMALIADRLGEGVDVTFAGIVPYTLIAGLFISDFPEALSSSVGMREHGISKNRILWLWISILIITACGAALGGFLGESLPHVLVVGIEGIAAGAMLTMIGATMLPEAAHIGGGNVAGLSTMFGFLAAIAFKFFE